MPTFITRTNQPLKVGMKIRLAGREGKVIRSSDGTDDVFWDNGSRNSLELFAFPSLEIEAPEVSISKEVAEKLCEMVAWAMSEEDLKRRINSLVKE